MDGETNIAINGKPSDVTLNTVDHYLQTLSQVIISISREEITTVIEVLFNAWKNRRTIFLCGNGGSAATAIHMANDLVKYTSVKGKPRFKAISLTSNISLVTAWANDTHFDQIFAEQLKNFLEPGDILLGISASGNSPNVLAAVEYAHSIDATVIGFTNKYGGKLRQMADYTISIPDDSVQRTEDGHLVLDHIICTSLRQLIEASID